MVALFPLFSILSSLLLIAYQRSSVTIDSNAHLGIETQFFVRSVNLLTLDSAKWIGSKTGAIHLFDGQRKTTIVFDYIDPISRHELIRSLRTLFPASKQEGWPEFCFRAALPLRKRIRLNEPLEPDEWRPRHKRSDVVFAVTTIIGFIITSGLAYACDRPNLLFYPLLLLIVKSENQKISRYIMDHPYMHQPPPLQRIQASRGGWCGALKGPPSLPPPSLLSSFLFPLSSLLCSLSALPVPYHLLNMTTLVVHSLYLLYWN